MKTIKEYINESLFDSEDDIMDKKLSSESIKWFEKHVKFVKNIGHSTVPASDVLSVNSDGLLVLKLPIGTRIEFYEQPPKWIQFDKKSWEDAFSDICYDVTSQKDIERIPQGRNGHIIKFSNNKTQNITVTGHCTFSSKSLKNILIDKNCQIDVQTDDINQLTEIKFTKYSILNYINLINCKLADELFKEYKRLKTKGFVNKYRDILTEMYKSVFALNLNNRKTFILGEVL